MTRVTLIVTALAIALVAVFAGTTTAQTDTRDRTFLTFSGAVEMPGVTLPAGTAPDVRASSRLFVKVAAPASDSRPMSALSASGLAVCGRGSVRVTCGAGSARAT